MADEITTMIVDDHEVVREGLRLSLSRAPHIRVVGEASDGCGKAVDERIGRAAAKHGRAQKRRRKGRRPIP